MSMREIELAIEKEVGRRVAVAEAKLVDQRRALDDQRQQAAERSRSLKAEFEKQKGELKILKSRVHEFETERQELYRQIRRLKEQSAEKQETQKEEA